VAWERTTISTPIPGAISDALQPVTSLLGAISPLLSTIKAFLQVAKAFLLDFGNIFEGLVDAGIQELEDAVNDLFGTGAFTLVVTPFTFELSDEQAEAIAKAYDRDVLSARTAYDKALLEINLNFRITTVERNRRLLNARTAYNASLNFAERKRSIGRKTDPITGFPLLSPAEAILAAFASFDDPGDPNRPQFSKSANVSMFGILLTSPTLGGLGDLLEKILSLFDIPEWRLLLRRVNRFRETPTDPSVVPDWRSFRLNSISHLASLQGELLDLIETLRGYLLSPKDSLVELANIIAEKVTTLLEIVDTIQNFINALTKVSGVYFLQVPIGVGGNERLKKALRDPILEDTCFKSNFTALALFAGGGPSAQPIHTIGGLFK
jgi:hypothetical protein